MMGGVNVVLLVLLVWTFTAVSEANIAITLKCEDVLAQVGKETTLTCTVTYPILRKNCSRKMYKFIKTGATDVQICRNYSGEERKFSCPYTANVTTKFKFFLQADCGHETTYFTVKVPGAVKGDAGGSNTLKSEGFGESAKETFGLTAAIISVMCLIIIIMGLIYKKKLNFINTGFQKNYNMDVHEKILSKCSDRETV